MKTSIINVTKIGNPIAYKIKENIEADLYSKYVIKNLENTQENIINKDLSLKNKSSYLLDSENRIKKQNFNLKKIVEKSFTEYDAVIFISSTGIAVRSIAPFIQSKDKDPAVIVIDSTGKYAISLLSGHLGGANKLTEKIAKIIGAEPIITTATDNLNIKAPDIIAKENNLVIEDLKKAKDIAALLVNGEKVAFIDEDDLIDFPKGYIYNIEDTKGLVIVTNKLHINEDSFKDDNFFKEDKQIILQNVDENKHIISQNKNKYREKNLTAEKSEEILTSQKVDKRTNPVHEYVQLKIKDEYLQRQSLNNKSLNDKCILKLIRKNIVLGIGCRKNYDENTMKENVIRVLKEENIDLKSINSIVSVEIKKDEKAINELSNFLECPFITYSVDEIKKIEHKFKGSDFVRKTIGIGSVCEPSIELKGATIIKEKQKLNGMTLAIGELSI
ncbi:cobalt-precorrin 5A hydrolase [Clostridium sporogenes]|uniref:Cobalt-precorrin 5A hydrolase n=1 Tax=Clostridium sporogenes TaxID=1509 RepID=A0AAE4JUL9_CLOSG|nr:cobalt-precorrin 5A hydrolase [Clostridium sporogenes]MDS1004478.1 cobalt-precorrin 5A hydrolase [Clostridium sporogenes]